MTLSPKKILFFILFFGFLIRIFGIGYGLPMWLVADEPPFVLGALKMMELKTVIPALHAEEFRSVLYYPPYISYLYLPFFTLIIGIKFLLFSGSSADFINYLGMDLSCFFLMARFLSVIFATLSIYLTYRVSRNIFKDDIGALAGSFFLSTSLLHTLLSTVSRQWVFISFIYILVLYFLSEPSYSFKKRYLLAVLAAGIGMGVSSIASISLIFVFLYFIFLEEKKISEIVREKFPYLLGVLFLCMSVLPTILYPLSAGFTKDLFEIDPNPLAFFKPLLFTESVFFAFFLAGLVFVFLKSRRIFWVFSIFTLSYYLIFYIIFRFEDRFILPLLSPFAILAGLGFAQLFSRWRYFIILLILPIIFSLRVGYLEYNNDSRINMKEWVDNNLPVGAKIIVSARLMRLSASLDAILELESLDPNSLRQVDRSELYFKGNLPSPTFHALNINSVENKYLSNIEDYIKKNGYEYLIISENDYRKDQELYDRFKKIAESGELLVQFGQDSGLSISESNLGRSPTELFETKELGPRVLLYRLKR